MRNIFVVAALFAAIGCEASQTLEQCETSFPNTSRWYNSGTHNPSVALDLLPDGTAKFVGGFRFYDSPTWRYDTESGELALTLPTATSLDLLTIGSDHVPRGYVDRLDEETRTLYWKVNSCTDHIYFQLHRFELQSMAAKVRQ